MDSCQCSPLSVPRLRKRAADVNTSVAEQVFAWFRGYAKTFNEMRPLRHHFLVLYYTRLHNLQIDLNQATYLNPMAPARQQRKAIKKYECTKVKNSKTYKNKNSRTHSVPGKRSMKSCMKVKYVQKSLTRNKSVAKSSSHTSK